MCRVLFDVFTGGKKSKPGQKAYRTGLRDDVAGKKYSRLLLQLLLLRDERRRGRMRGGRERRRVKRRGEREEEREIERENILPVCVLLQLRCLKNKC